MFILAIVAVLITASIERFISVVYLVIYSSGLIYHLNRSLSTLPLNLDFSLHCPNNKVISGYLGRDDFQEWIKEKGYVKDII